MAESVDALCSDRSGEILARSSRVTCIVIFGAVKKPLFILEINI